MLRDAKGRALFDKKTGHQVAALAHHVLAGRLPFHTNIGHLGSEKTGGVEGTGRKEGFKHTV